MTKPKSVAIVEPPQEAVALAKEAPMEGEAPSASFIPRLVVLQALSDNDLLTMFGRGGLIIQPDLVSVAAFGDRVSAVPVFYYTSWQKWKDRRDDANAPPVEVFDPNDPIAVAAKNKDTWFELYPGHEEMAPDDQRSYRNQECLNFILEIRDGEAAGKVAIATFARGGHKFGTMLWRYLKRRHEEQSVPIFGNLLYFFVADETARGNTWQQLKHEVPKDPFVRDGAAEMKRLHEVWQGFKTMLAQRGLQTAAPSE